MMAWQQFVPLVVLLASDGTLATKDVECAYPDETFCAFVIMAYEQAGVVAKVLKGQRFREDKHRVSQLKLEILKILRIEEKPELLPHLKKALGLATNALFQLKVSCTGKREEQVCKTGLRGLFHVTYDLVVAAMQVAVGAQLEKIEAALTTFGNSHLERNNVTLLETVDDGYTLGITALEAI